MGALPSKRRVAVRGPHGLGKTALSAWVVWWFALTRDGEDWKIITTASAWRQLEVYLWPEIHKWGRLIRWDRIGRAPVTDAELLMLNLNLTGASAVRQQSAALIDTRTLTDPVPSTSPRPSPRTWDAAEWRSGARRGAWRPTLAVSIAAEPIYRFYDIHRRPGFEDWTVRT